jgi:recombinational DNA repair ATPase RecF
VLLLDDVLSELDGKRGAAVMENIRGTQTLVTCAERGEFGFGRADARFYEVAGDTATPVE